ncbi:MerR family transcriptional regulator [Allokutzneria oryzae]|uniref:MerR family transcriptional regulator n=1 Tax=Allokutzneria oryzae TaxID=1378989 RepID=A0ABV5ZRY9_9PSEU
MSYTVGQVAAFARVTVRTLHHYDEIGLLSPGGRTAAGYRRYDDADLERLHRILSYRELGFPLDEIATIVTDPDTDTMGHLRRQRALLLARIDRLQDMVTAVNREMEAQRMGIPLTPEERFEIFGEWQPADGYGERAEQRWGHTEEWQQAQKTMSQFSKEDFVRMQAEQAEWVERLLVALDEGVAADSERAMDLAEAHRRLIGALYDCSYERHQQIAELYVTDAEQLAFVVPPGKQRPGIGEFIRDAVRANAARHVN